MSNKYIHQFFLILILSLCLLIAFVIAPRSTSIVDVPVEKEPKNEEVVQQPVDTTIRMLAFGDMMFDRGVRKRMAEGVEPFKYINDFKGSTTLDVITANLEGPIIETERTNCQAKAYSFQFAHSVIPMFKDAGFNVLNLANNHSYDCYLAGLESTQKLLGEANIVYFGGGKDINQSYAIQEVKGKKIAYVGIDITVHAIPIEQFYPLIQRLNAENDLVVVQIHWGDEYNLWYTSTQQIVGHKLIDAGADIVIGHHPHVTEPLEVYKGKPLFYSLGNFVFDQIGVDENKGLAAIISLNEKTTIELLPFNIVRSQPQLFNEEEKAAFCKKYLVSFDSQNINTCELTIQ